MPQVHVGDILHSSLTNSMRRKWGVLASGVLHIAACRESTANTQPGCRPVVSFSSESPQVLAGYLTLAYDSTVQNQVA